jgi:hypothetical protein
MRRDWFGWRGDESGSVMVLAGVGIALSVGVAAFAVDLSNAYSVKGRLQNAADAAALAAAQKLPGAPEEARAAALELTGLNVRAGDGIVARDADVELGRWAGETRTFTAGLTPYNAVKVTTRRSAAAGNPVPTYFAGLFGAGQLDVAAEAIAVLSPLPCVIALDPAASGAFEATGTAEVRAPNCGIQVNSTASDALLANGASSIAAAHICLAGGYRGRDIAPLPDSGCRLRPDPLRAVAEPGDPGGCYLQDVTITGNLDLPAGVKLCGRIQVTGSARLWLNPGIVYFETAELHLAGSASIEGSDVMLFFDRDSSFHLASQGVLRLDPPRTGTYRGISIFQSRLGSLRRGKITGGREVEIGGTIYAPRLDLELAGHSNLLSQMQAGHVIANTFKFAGTAEAAFERPRVTPAALTANAALVE